MLLSRSGRAPNLLDDEAVICFLAFLRKSVNTDATVANPEEPEGGGGFPTKRT